MSYSSIRNGCSGEQRLLRFMGAGGPEMHANAVPEPIDSQDEHLDRVEEHLDESDRLLDEIDTGLDTANQLLAERVEDVAGELKDQADVVMNSTNEFLLSRVGTVRETIQAILQEERDVHQESRQNVRARREANVTDPRSADLSQEGLMLSQMALRLANMMGENVDEMFGVGDALDAGLEDQEQNPEEGPTIRSETWRKVEGGEVAATDTAKDTEEEKAFVPSPSVERNAKDIVLAMNIQNGTAQGQEVDAAAAFTDLRSEFSSLEPDEKDAFVSWMNKQIDSSLPYEASNGEGGLRIDRTA